jgi:hypothetical protein
MRDKHISAGGLVAYEQPAAEARGQITPSNELLIKTEELGDRISTPEETGASEATSAASNGRVNADPFGTMLSEAWRAQIPEIRAPSPDERWGPGLRRNGPRVGVGRMALMATLGVGFAGGWGCGLLDYLGREWSTTSIPLVVERIIQAESNGCANAKNKRSTATGAAQFLDETWLLLIRAHRPELARQSEREVLELRRDPGLSREMTTRLAEKNAMRLRQRGFSVTPGVLYLSHFAGSAGAIAILSAPESADAASIMASADMTSRITRDKIVSANPFLQRFTVADLKRWADRKMEKQQLNQSCGPLQQRRSVATLPSSAATA